MSASNSQSREERQPTERELISAEIAMLNPLQEETRKARLYLLGASLIGITIVHTGLVPKELTTLGLTFGTADRQSLLFILALVTLYFLVAFVIYGLSDFVTWRNTYSRRKSLELDAITEMHAAEVEQGMLELEQMKRGEAEAAILAARRKAIEDAKRIYRADAWSDRDRVLSRYAPLVSVVRVLFEFLLPLLVGFYAIYALLSA